MNFGTHKVACSLLLEYNISDLIVAINLINFLCLMGWNCKPTLTGRVLIKPIKAFFKRVIYNVLERCKFCKGIL